MNKEEYTVPQAELVLLSLEDVYMLGLESKTDGNELEEWADDE